MGKKNNNPEQQPKVKNRNTKCKQTYQPANKQSRECRKCPESIKFYIDVSDSFQSDGFNKTVKDIPIYIGSKYRKNEDIVCALDTLEDVDCAILL